MYTGMFDGFGRQLVFIAIAIGLAMFALGVLVGWLAL